MTVLTAPKRKPETSAASRPDKQAPGAAASPPTPSSRTSFVFRLCFAFLVCTTVAGVAYIAFLRTELETALAAQCAQQQSIRYNQEVMSALLAKLPRPSGETAAALADLDDRLQGIERSLTAVRESDEFQTRRQADLALIRSQIVALKDLMDEQHQARLAHLAGLSKTRQAELAGIQREQQKTLATLSKKLTELPAPKKEAAPAPAVKEAKAPVKEAPVVAVPEEYKRKDSLTIEGVHFKRESGDHWDLYAAVDTKPKIVHDAMGVAWDETTRLLRDSRKFLRNDAPHIFVFLVERRSDYLRLGRWYLSTIQGNPAYERTKELLWTVPAFSFIGAPGEPGVNVFVCESDFEEAAYPKGFLTHVFANMLLSLCVGRSDEAGVFRAKASALPLWLLAAYGYQVEIEKYKIASTHYVDWENFEDMKFGESRLYTSESFKNGRGWGTMAKGLMRGRKEPIALEHLLNIRVGDLTPEMSVYLYSFGAYLMQSSSQRRRFNGFIQAYRQEGAEAIPSLLEAYRMKDLKQMEKRWHAFVERELR